MPRNPDRETVFRFKQFEVRNSASAMKVGTDGVLLGAWFDMAAGMDVLDVGTGCGLIALMAAQRGAVKVDAVEIDEAAYAEATVNAAASPWPSVVSVRLADFLDAVFAMRYDRVVCNPPFFVTGQQAPDSSRAAARHEGALTVDALLRRGAALLKPDGRIAMITPAERYDDVMMSAALAGLSPIRLCRVSTRQGKAHVRLLWELSREGGVCVTSAMVINSPEYNDAVSPFYLNIN